jgi:ubiquinone/menaquinone biosynthesis C-methylase UbiE
MEEHKKKRVMDQGHTEWLRNQEETWEKRAADYSKLDWVQKKDFLEKFVEFCEAEPHWAALDVGTGPGIIAAAVRPKVSCVIGIDIAPEMTKRAVELHGHIPGLSFAIGDVEDLDFPSEAVDLVTARMVFHNVADCPLGFSEVWRILKPGGRFVFCEGVPPDHLTRPRYEQIFALKEKRHTFSEADLIYLFDRAGFEDITLKPYFMRQVSLNNWLGNGALEPAAIAEIRRLHLDADDHFKRIYRLNARDGDVFMDWKFIIIRGRKPLEAGMKRAR